MGNTGKSKWEGGSGGGAGTSPDKKPPKSRDKDKEEAGGVDAGYDVDGYDWKKDKEKKDGKKDKSPGEYKIQKVYECNRCHFEYSTYSGEKCGNCNTGKLESKEVKRLFKGNKWIKSKVDIEKQRTARSMVESKEAKASRLAYQEYISKKASTYYKKTGKVPTAEQRKSWEKEFEADLKKTLTRHETKWRADYERMFGKTAEKGWKEYLTKTASSSEIPKTRGWAEQILRMRGK